MKKAIKVADKQSLLFKDNIPLFPSHSNVPSPSPSQTVVATANCSMDNLAETFADITLSTSNTNAADKALGKDTKPLKGLGISGRATR